MNNSDMNIAKALDIELPLEEKPILKVEEDTQVVLSVTGGYVASDADDDYKVVRKNLKVVIEQSNSAIQGILELAEDSQQPRAYEVVAQMIKTLADANREVLDLHDRVKKIRKQDITTNNVSNTNNSIYVGSTKELQDIINTARSSTKAFANRPDILESIQEDRDE